MDLLSLSEFYYIAELGEKLKCSIPSRNLSGGAIGKPTGVGGAEIAILLGVGHLRFGCSQLIMKVAARVLVQHTLSLFSLPECWYKAGVLSVLCVQHSLVVG